MPSIQSHQNRLEALVAASPVIPVVSVAGAEQAVALAGALHESGLRTVEITLRTPGALEGIAAVRQALPDVTVGAGTVLDAAQMRAASEAGCRFSVSPGVTDAVLAASLEFDLPLLPGAATPGETQALLERGVRLQKFFPAEPCGGLAYLNALAGPYPQVRFCPTGGINADNAPQYLAASNVACVGGSWMAPASAVNSGDWDTVRDRSARAARMAASSGSSPAGAG